MPANLFLQARKSRAAHNAAASYLSAISIAARGILAIPIAVAYLDTEQLGLWAIVSAVIGYLVWADMGIGTATGRLIAEATAAKDRPEINAWWTASCVTLMALGFVVIIAGTSVTPLLLSWFEISAQNAADARWLIIGAVLVTGLSFPIKGYPGLLTAQHRFHLSLLVLTITPWVNLLVFFLLLAWGFGLKAYVGALAATHLSSYVLYRICIAIGPDRPEITLKSFDLSRVRQLFSLSGNMTIVGFVDSLLETIPAMIIGRFGGLTAVPSYTITWRGPFMAVGLGKRTFQSFYPGLQRLYVTGQRDQFPGRHQQICLLLLGASMLTASAIFLLNPMMVEILAGSGYYAGHSVNVWFAIAAVTTPVAGCYRVLLLVSGSMRRHALVAVAKLACGILGGVLAWRWFGYEGLAVLFCILPLFNGIYGFLAGSRACGFSPGQLGGRVIPWLAVSFALLVLTAIIIKHITQQASGAFIELAGYSFHTPSPTHAFVALIPAVLGLILIVKHLPGNSPDHEVAQ